MCTLFSACCFFCCTNPTTETAKTIAMSTLEKIEKILEKEFFPISIQESIANLKSDSNKYYRPKLLHCGNTPKPGFVKETLFKQQLLASIKRGLEQSQVNAWSITDQEERIISTQLTHLILTAMLTEQTQFTYDRNLIGCSNLFDAKPMPSYKQLHKEEVEKFLDTVRSFPNGSQVDVKTQNPVEHNALDVQLTQAISTALEKLDIAQATSTSLKTFRSDELNQKTRDAQQLAEMFEKNPLEMNRS